MILARLLYHTRCRTRRHIVAVAAALPLTLVPLQARAHEVPERVAIRAFVQRDSSVLRLFVRVPLEAMRDVDFPLRTDGSLDLVRVRALLAEAAQVWIAGSIALTADGSSLDAPRIDGTRIALPNDRSFEGFASARAAFALPPLENETLQWRQALFDVALSYALPAGAERLVLHPNLARLGVRTTSVVHIIDGNGSDRVLTYAGNPESVALDPAWYQTALQFVRDGFHHIPGGLDHLLFLFCLVLPLRQWRPLIGIVTAFTLAHSITLAAAALGLVPTALWFAPLVETLIAASIVWLAIENVVLAEARLSGRWPVAFVFGLVHGFGFSFAVRDTLQFAGSNLVTALAAFNVGVEFGQLAALTAIVPLLWLVRRYAGAGRDRVVVIVGSVLVAHSAWHWMTDRAAELAAYRGSLSWPALDATFALGAMRIALLAAVALAVALALRQILRVPRRS